MRRRKEKEECEGKKEGVKEDRKEYVEGLLVLQDPVRGVETCAKREDLTRAFKVDRKKLPRNIIVRQIERAEL